MLRYVRYAAAVVFALLAVGFVGLWGRSYYRADIIYGPIGAGRDFAGGSVNGRAVFGVSSNKTPLKDWKAQSYSGVPRNYFGWKSLILGGFHFEIGAKSSQLKLPYWFLALSSLGLAALLAFKRTWRFSLRSVLLATTILAAILGLAVYLV